jgi:hypothetical protein
MVSERRRTRYAVRSRRLSFRKIVGWLADQKGHIGAWLGLGAVAAVGFWFAHSLISQP